MEMKTKLYFFIKNIILYIIIFILGISFSTFAWTTINIQGNWSEAGNGNLYWIPNNGSSVTGWLQYNNEWYYIQNNVMLRDVIVEGYPVNAEGKYQPGYQPPSGNNQIISDNTTNLNTSTTTDILQNGSEDCIIPFSKITSIGGNEKQYDFYGVLLKGEINSYSGNRNFLKKNDLINEFSELLTKCSYQGDFWKDFIEFLRQKLGIQAGTYFVKPNMEMRSQEMNAMTKRNRALVPAMLKEKMDLIIAAIGLFLIAYGTLLIICGVIDELGLVNRYMTAIVSGGLLSKNRNGDMTLTGNPSAFRKMYLGVGLSIIFIGVLCLSAPIRFWFVDKIMALKDIIFNFMRMSTDTINNMGGNQGN